MRHLKKRRRLPAVLRKCMTPIRHSAWWRSQAAQGHSFSKPLRDSINLVEVFAELRSVGYDVHPGDLENLTKTGLKLEQLPFGLVKLGTTAVRRTPFAVPCSVLLR
jgi:hypothetical protein